jgi:predicted RNA-binding Zn-ribbon protein involved in translation (DUF1610 family)
MSHTPSIDYMCPHCGAQQTYHLVPARDSERPAVSADETPSIEFLCSSCGATATYMLVPAS